MHYTKFNIDTWARKEHFHVFKNYAQNAFSMTVEIDITEFLAFVKMNNYKFYPAMIHQVATIFNRYPEFRMAMKEDDLIVYDQVNPSYTIAHPEQESFSSIWSEYKNDMAEFLLEYEQDTEKYGDNLSYFPKEHTPDNIFYISVLSSRLKYLPNVTMGVNRFCKLANCILKLVKETHGRADI